MDILERIQRRVAAGEIIEQDEFEALRALAERIADLEETIASGGADTVLPETAPSTGPALAIVVGHTRRSPGARASAPINENEYAWNDDLARILSHACTARDVEHRIFHRDGVGISGAYRQISAWGASVAVELHFNAFNGSAHGTETLYNKETHAKAEAWAWVLQDAMLSALGLRDRGLKERDPGDRGYGSVSAIPIPIALVEPFFGDNPGDAATAHGTKDILAEALAEAAAGWLRTV